VHIKSSATITPESTGLRFESFQDIVMSGGECQTKNKNEYDKEEDQKPIVALDEGTVQVVYYMSETLPVCIVHRRYCSFEDLRYWSIHQRHQGGRGRY
jgi:hypothetical protein